MIDLIRAAARCKGAELSGKFIARAEMRIGHDTDNASAELTLSRERLAVIRASGGDSELTLKLMPGGGNVGAAHVPIPEVTEELLFSAGDIKRYLAVSGDTNPIHSGMRPVVPGLLLLLRLLPERNFTAAARFRAPVYAGERIFVHRADGAITVYSQSGIAAEITIKGVFLS